MIFVGIAGAYSFVMPIQEASAVSEEALESENIWDGIYDGTYTSGIDFYIGEDSEAGSYYIYTAKGLAYFAYSVNNGMTYSSSTVYLCTDINLNNEEWTPMGTTYGFYGTFDGQGHTIYNMRISSTSGNVGFFSSVNSATIKNLSLENVCISSGTNNIGGLVGYAQNSVIENCSVSGKISVSSASAVGGLVGNFVGTTTGNNSTYNVANSEDANNVIKSSRNLATISGQGYIGGLVGYASNGVAILMSYNSGDIERISGASGNTYTGGLVGYANPYSSDYYIYISQSYNAGDIDVDDMYYVGGLVAYVSTISSSSSSNATYFLIEESFNRGNFIYSSSSNNLRRIGGLIAYVTTASGVEVGDETIAFDRVFNVGKVYNGTDTSLPASLSTYSEIAYINNTGSQTGGLIFVDADYASAYGNSSSIYTGWTTLFNVEEISLMTEKFKTASMGGAGFFSEKDGDSTITNIAQSSVWGMSRSENGGYPYLKISFVNSDASTTVDSLWEGEGTLESPYLIYTAGDLSLLAQYYNTTPYNNETTTITYFSLQNDIDLSAKSWTPIGIGYTSPDDSYPYAFNNAVFDGNNHTISGVNISMQNSYSYLGLFGYVSNTIIQNLIIDDFRFVGTTSERAVVGKLVGYLDNSYVINCADLDSSTMTGSGEDEVDTIGDSNNNSYIIYGINNIITNEETENFGGIVDGSATGYVVYIDTAGGTIYESIERAESTDIRLWQSELVIINNKIADLSSFGNLYLTTLPTNYNPDNTTSNVIVKEGYKLENYYIGKTDSSIDLENFSVSGSISLGDNAISAVKYGFIANWSEEEDDVEITVYYNYYEYANGYADASGASVGKKSFTIFSKYNQFWTTESFIAEINNKLESEGVTREGFEIVGVYDGFVEEDFSDSNVLENETGLFFVDNENFYIKWEGDDSSSYVLNLSVSTQESIAGVDMTNPSSFSLSNAIASAKIIIDDSSENGSEYDITSFLISGSYDFNYFTTYVDTASEQIKIQINLNEGYHFTSDSGSVTNNSFQDSTSIQSNYSDIYGYYGLTSSLTKTTDLNNYDYNDQIEVCLKNIVGSGGLSFTIERNNYSNKLNVSSDIYFGVTLPVAISNMYNLTVATSDGSFNYIETFINDTNYFNLLSSNMPFYLGVNLFNGYLIASTEEFDSSANYIGTGLSLTTFNISGTTVTISNNGSVEGILFRYSITGAVTEYYYYLVTITNDGDGTVQTLYQLSSGSSGYTIMDQIFTLSLLSTSDSEYEMEMIYYANSNFGLVFSTETFDTQISDYTTTHAEVLISNTSSVSANSEEVQKIFYNIESAQNLFPNDLTVSSSKTTITYNFKFAIYDDDGNLVDISDEEDLPTLVIGAGESNSETVNTITSTGATSVSLNVNNYNKINVTLTNSNTYVWAHRDFGSLPTVGMFSGTSSSNGEIIYTYISDYNSASLYVTPISNENGEYYTANDLFDNDFNPATNGTFGYNRVNSDTDTKFYYTYEMTYNILNLLSAPIDFDIVFVLQKAEYQISVSSVYKQSDNGTEYTDETNETTISVNSGVDSGSAELSSSDNFVISTNTDNAGYNFTGFRISLGDSSTFISTATPLSMAMQDFLNEYKATYTTLSNDDVYEFSIEAVYVSKSVNYFATFNKFIIYEYNGSSSYQLSSGTVGSVSVNENGALNGNFSYHSQDSDENVSTPLESSNFTFSLNSTYSNYYYVVGYAILSSSDYTLSGIVTVSENSKITADNDLMGSKDSSATIYGSDVAEFLQEKMKNSEFMANFEGSTFYIVPVLMQRTLKITISAGGDGDAVYNNENNDVSGYGVEITFYYTSNSTLDTSSLYSVSSGNDVSRNYSVLITGDSGSLTSIILNSFFNKRVGYSANGWIVTGEGVSTLTFTSSLSLSSYFSVGEITITRNWQANSISFIYYSNDSRYDSSIYGTSTTRSYTVTWNYDDNDMALDDGSAFAITGYEFVGWYVYRVVNSTTIQMYSGENNPIFYSNTDVKNIITGSNEQIAGEVYGTALYIYAVWEAKTYRVAIDANGGSFSDNVLDNGGSSLNDDKTVMTVSLTYNELFTTNSLLSIIIANSGNNYLSRTDFVFDGLYAYDGSSTKTSSNQITNSSYLRTSISGFSDSVFDSENSSQIALTLYVTWAYNVTGVTISTNEVTLSYTGSTFTMSPNDFNFVSSYLHVTSSEIFNISYPNTTAKVNVELSFTSESVDVSTSGSQDNVSWNFTVPKNVGIYYIYLTVNLVDDISIYSLGTFTSIYVTLTVNITQADIGYTQTDALQLKNIQYLISLVGSSSDITWANSFTTFSALVDDLNNNEGTSLSTNNAYEYLFMKYYLMASSRSDFAVFNNWTYSDYLSYYGNVLYYGSDEYVTNSSELSSARQTRISVLGNSLFLFSYDFESADSNTETLAMLAIDTYRYSISDIVLSSSSAMEVVATELNIISIVAYASRSLIPGYSYEVRVYLSASDESVFNNYNVMTDSTNQRYVVLGRAFMLMQVLKLVNNATSKSNYYNGSTYSVSYVGDDQEGHIYYDGTTLYQFEAGSELYIGLDIQTSNAGDAEVDTVFNIYDANNYFILSNLRIVTFTGDTAHDFTNYYSYFNIILDESFTYTIFNVINTAQITLTPTYFTRYEGFEANISLGEDLINGLSNGLFSIMSFTYSTDGAAVLTYSMLDGNGNTVALSDGQHFTDDGSILLMTLENNNSNEVVFYTSPAVVAVEIRINHTLLGEYVKYYNILNEQPTDLEDAYSSSAEYSLVLKSKNSSGIFESSITYLSGEITPLTYYAVYSDFVKIYYDMNITGADEYISSYLQLGVDTIDMVLDLSQSNLEMSDLKYTLPTGEEVSYTNLFDSLTGLFIGADSLDPHTSVVLKAYWRLGEIILDIYKTEFKYSAGSVSAFYIDLVARMMNDESSMFNYTYEIWQGDTLISSTSDYDSLMIAFDGGGSTLDNGTYTFKITVSVNSRYTYILDADSPTEVYASTSFTIEFYLNKVVSVAFNTTDSVTYNGLDWTSEFVFVLTYYEFDEELEDYKTETTATTYYYGFSYHLGFEISLEQTLVEEVVDVGNYYVTINLSSSYYSSDSDSSLSYTFNFVVNRLNINLYDYQLSTSKNFNAADPTFSFAYRIANQSVTFYLKRTDTSEDLGTNYALFFSSFESLDNNNFTISYNDTTLFDGTNITEAASTTQVGTFSIVQTGDLRIYWQETSSVSSTLTVVYDEDGYKASISSDGKTLYIYNGDDSEAQIALSFYDITQGADVRDDDIFDIILPLIAEITISLSSSGSTYDVAYNAGTYTFSLSNTSSLQAYFRNITFSAANTLQISPLTIDISEITFEKVYDGDTSIYLTIDGETIDDFEEYSGLYLYGIYTSSHVGENILMTIYLRSSDESINTSNYQLSTSSTYGEITKREATITFTLPEGATYEYGDLTLASFTSNFLSYEVKGENGEDLTEMFKDSYFSLNFTIDGTVQTNAQGYIYAGTYNLATVSEYQDFDITEEILPTLTISPYSYSLTLEDGFITIDTLQTVSEYYTESLYIEDTGDVVSVNFYPQTALVGYQASAGNYNLTLAGGVYTQKIYNDNIELTINSGNTAFAVLAYEGLIYIRILNTDYLTQTYNGNEFTFEVNTSGKTIAVKNNDETISTISFEYLQYDGNSLSTVSEISGLSFTISASTSSEIISAGTYRLKVTLAEDSSSYNLTFDTTYNFTVQQKTLSFDASIFDKVYDGTTTKEVVAQTSMGLIGGDSVTIRGIYSSAKAADSVSVRLVLTGDDSDNYTLATTSIYATISQRTVSIRLVEDSYEYGDVSTNTTFTYVVSYLDGDDEIIVSSTAYTVTQNLIYNGEGYLPYSEESYTIEIVFASENYTTDQTELTFKVTKRSLEIIFTTPGVYMGSFGDEETTRTTFTRTYSTAYGDNITITFTREEGSAIGYYEITGGTLSDDGVNYYLETVRDDNTDGYGAYRIVASSSLVYLLASDQDTITADDADEGVLLSFVYDGITYTTVTFSVNTEQQTYSLILSDAVGNTQTFVLNLYSYNATTDTYTKLTSVFDSTITATSFSLSNEVLNAGTYYIYNSNAESQNFAVKLGKNASLYAFQISVERKSLVFNTETIEKQFTNENAEYIYENASEILNGIIGTDSVSLIVRFYDGSDLAIYVGDNYSVEGELYGADSSNYEILIQTSDNVTVTGSITKAPINIVIENQYVIYGDASTKNGQVEIYYEFTSDSINLSNYAKSMSADFTLFASNGVTYSTTGYLNAGIYQIIFEELSSDDFYINLFITGDDSYSEPSATLTVNALTLTISALSESLTDIFTKSYDGTTNVEIFNSEDELRFSVSGFIDGDDVELVSANYASADVGRNIEITFTLSGNDADNYNISSYTSGVIESIIISLNFNYNAEAGEYIYSNVEYGGYPLISELVYPFLSSSSLVANAESGDMTSNNFPSWLQGKTGHTFSHWSLDFELESLQDPALTTLVTSLSNLASSLSISYSFENNVFSFVVANNMATVSLLNNLISDETYSALGLYFLGQDEIEVTFNAVWSTITSDVYITVSKDGTPSSNYATTYVNETPIAGSSYQTSISYGNSLVIRVVLNEHYKVLQFYNNLTNSAYVSDGSNITIETIELSDTGWYQTTITFLNVTDVINIDIQIVSSDVSITLDLSGFADNENITVNDSRFVKVGDTAMYVWNTTYEEIEELTLTTLPELIYPSYSVTGYSFATSSGSIGVNIDAAASLYLKNYVIEVNNGDYQITYSPIMLGVSVSVYLNYNFDGNYQTDDNDQIYTISVPYNSTYNDGDGWVETPSREGYDFLGWYTSSSSETRITGADVMSSLEPITLYARWQIQQNTIYLSFENMTLTSATISNQDVSYTISNSYYVFSDLTYGTTITLTFELQEGYNINSVYYYYNLVEGTFQVESFSTDGQVGTVTFNVPAQPAAYLVVESGLNENEIRVVGDHITSVTATDTSGNPLSSKDSNIFIAETNMNIIVSIVIESGYVYESVSFSQTATYIQEYNENTNTVILTIYGVTRDIEININVRERLNTVTVVFETPSHNEQFVVGTSFYTNLTFEVETGDTFAFYTSILHGYKIWEINSTENDTIISSWVLIEEPGLVNGFYFVEVSNIYSDITITIITIKESYKISIVTINYDDNGQEDNEANNISYICYDSMQYTEIEVEYETEVELVSEVVEDGYYFAGYSLDESTIFASDSSTTYIVEDAVTIYAIFSKVRYEISYAVYNYYQLNELSGSTGEVYEQLSQRVVYANASLTQAITSSTLYYGTSIMLYLNIPTGYIFYGFGYYEINSPNNRTFITYDEGEGQIEIYLSASDFVDANSYNLVVFIALSPREVSINISSWIDYDGYYEEDNLAGNISLVNAFGDSVNSNGYIVGTNNHYSSQYFANGSPTSTRNFDIISYTNSTIYLKIYAERDGYYFKSVSASGLTATLVGYVDDGNGTPYYLYQFTGIIGGTSANIQVYFTAEKRIISYDFVNENLETVSGGNMSIVVDDDNLNKVWSDGTNFSSMNVTSFVDTYYTVVAYVRLGFIIDEDESFLIYDDSLVTVSNVAFDAVLSESTYYTYRLTFTVSEYRTNTSISISLVPQTYTVLLRDTTLEGDSDVLVEIRNVKYHELLDLSVSNVENLIYDTSLFQFVNGVLDIVQTKDNYSFGGYFTYENGSGTQYINSSGVAILNFMENGYIFDDKENVYVLSDNAEIVDGQIVISLYLYWVYLKTQISFEIIPSNIYSIDAQDIVNGINDYNSWYSDNSPYYLEVSFNTNITFTAPEISGYSFYRFLIRQRDADGNWLTDVVSYQSSVPWSTNEYDRIVQVEVYLYYFAKVDVILYGGEMEYEIVQQTDDSYAQALISQGYVDTTKEFTIRAIESDGYEFRYWINVSTSMRYDTSELTTTINQQTIFFLYCQGKTVTLSFREYSVINGQIVILQINSLQGGLSAINLGRYSDDGFVKVTETTEVKVGDTLTFVVSIDFGYGVVWDLNFSNDVSWSASEIQLSSMDSNYYYFTLTLDSRYANQVVEILPTFSGESVALYITQSFAEELENAMDNNDASLAGYFVYQNETTSVVFSSIFQDINIQVALYDRYAINSITIVSNNGEEIDVTEYYSASQGYLRLTSEVLENIAGTYNLKVVYDRLYFTANEIVERGDGTEDSPYLISSIEELTYYMEKINNGEYNASGLKYSEASYLLEANLDLVEKFWTPIGTEENPFNGTFNFNGNSITSIYLARVYNPTYYDNLFGVLGENAVIILSTDNIWYIFVIVGVLLLLIIILIIILITNKRKKKKREELEVR